MRKKGGIITVVAAGSSKVVTFEHFLSTYLNKWMCQSSPRKWFIWVFSSSISIRRQAIIVHLLFIGQSWVIDDRIRQWV
jgi:hypothetical protein